MARKLTIEEVTKEVRDIENRPWPYSPMLLVKNLYDGRTGCIYRADKGGAETIVPAVIPVKDLAKAIRTMRERKEIYVEEVHPTLRAMVEAGWVVD